jgi:hypothetical protein
VARELVLVDRARSADVGVGRADDPELERIHAELLLELEPEQQRLAHVDVRRQRRRAAAPDMSCMRAIVSFS